MADVGNMPDYLPDADAPFAAWVRNFNDYVAAHADALPFSEEERAALAESASAFAHARGRCDSARVEMAAAHEAKGEARGACEEVVRSMANRLRADRDVTDADRLAMGLRARRSARHAIPLPDVRPVPHVRAIEPFTHRLRVGGEGDLTGTRKPDGVVGAEVWLTVADPAGGEASEPRYIGLATDGWFTATHDGRLAGKRAGYKLRWVTTRGQRGPFGPVASATIAA